MHQCQGSTTVTLELTAPAMAMVTPSWLRSEPLDWGMLKSNDARACKGDTTHSPRDSYQSPRMLAA